jgi:transcription elongation factor Elf1
MSGQLTCGNCGHSWWSNADSSRSRCGACRSVVYVPSHVRNGADSTVPEPVNAEDDEDAHSGATVLVVIGLAVIIVVAGVIWLRRNKAPSEPGYQLRVGAMTRWSCGHEATLSRPLDPGVTVGTAPCPFCGRAGIDGQYVTGSYLLIE